VDDVLVLERDGEVAIATMNRPEVRNALNAALRRALWTTFVELDADESVAVVVLTGADPAFSAGIDLKELGASAGGLSDDAHDGGGAAGGGVAAALSGDSSPIPPMSKPVIGAVNGVAVTGGFELALACDFLVASERARFADTHARVGIQPGWGLTVALPQAVGLRRARELSFTGNYLDAATAASWGLVNHVVDHDELMSVTLGLAHDVAGNDAAGVARIRRTYAEGSLLTGGDALELESRVSVEWIRTVAGADVEARRRAVIERGRGQVSG
jgi:enoyl-CoA hydratase